MEKKHVCPFWLAYFLILPLRKFSHNPKKLLSPYIKSGMKVIDYGSAMGYFSLPMARMVGNEGKVYSFDIQERLLKKLVSRAKKTKLDNIIAPRLVTNQETFKGLDQSIDFALLFYVVHEVTDQLELFENLAMMLKPGALILFVEPPGHVKQKDFEQSVYLAEKAGLKKHKQLKIGINHAILLGKE